MLATLAGIELPTAHISIAEVCQGQAKPLIRQRVRYEAALPLCSYLHAPAR